jgi:flavin reductase (DIM6/NTAB) family NADH-FMN oxidoreductase RutF
MERRCSELSAAAWLGARPQVLAPRVKEAAVQLECKLRHAHELRDASGTVTTTVVLGEVVLAHIHEGVAGERLLLRRLLRLRLLFHLRRDSTGDRRRPQYPR